ncbi:hypothetical protein RugamoR57_21500 [Duganella caerulea]|uniref:T6SS immunity protein Tli4 family protein n=1 Tax=Duganella caerulea TaxID=2885762 RepID=UPI0030E95191
MGRFLIDLPPSAELGATEVEYKAVYGFDGIYSGEARGNLHFGEVKIAETVPTEKAGLDRVHRAVKTRIGSPEMFEDILKARQNDVKYLVDRMAKSSPEDAAGDVDLLKVRKDRVQEVLFNAKVTGEAKLDDANGFAVRLGSNYVLGFYDPQDQRVRTFSDGRVTSKIDSAQGAAEEYRRVRATYHSRAPTDIPTTPGFCTNYGFIDEPLRPEVNVRMRVPIQIKQYPNLLLFLETEPAGENGARNIQKFPNMDADTNQLDKVAVKRKHGPKAEQILGTPGRSYGQEYGDYCFENECWPREQAYDMEAKTFGEPDNVERPLLTLFMTAAKSDDYKLKLPAEPKGNNVPTRPALSGHVPPPFEVGQEIFEQVLHSIRPRPGGIAGQGETPAKVAR